jgi:hypothetical protein
VLNGDMPFFLGDMDLLVSDLKRWNVNGEVIAVFHGDAAYIVLNDEAYDANRHVQTGHPVQMGNPYRKLLAALMEQGVQIEAVRRHRHGQPLDQQGPPSRREG